jgi:hypothetical protein
VVVRLAGVRAVFAAPVARFAVERFAAGFRAVDARVEPALAVVARDVVVFLARDAAGLRAAALRAVFLRPEDLRALLRVDRDAEPALLLEPSSAVHLPDMTRCAASATASAMIEPSLVALDITLVAAWDAVSAASSPASRILRRAAGLALIAAAAAARPAASISLLIAALASLSMVSDAEDLEDVFRVDLAIAVVSLRRVKDTLGL